MPRTPRSGSGVGWAHPGRLVVVVVVVVVLLLLVLVGVGVGAWAGGPAPRPLARLVPLAMTARGGVVMHVGVVMAVVMVGVATACVVMGGTAGAPVSTTAG